MTKLFLLAALMTLSLSALAVDPPAANGLGQTEELVAGVLPVEGCNLNVNGGTGNGQPRGTNGVQNGDSGRGATR